MSHKNFSKHLIL